MVRVERHEQVAVVRMERGVTNALNLRLVNEMSEALSELQRDTAVHGLVLSGSNEKFFSIGFDIPGLLELSEDDLRVYYESFNRLSIDLYTLPKPTVAAVAGHAIAGGCILALCCDYRFIAEGRKLMGLNEIKLGLPVPYPADCILRHLVAAPTARDVVEGGEFFGPEELLRMGIVDEVLPPDRVISASIERALSLGRMPPEAFGMIKRNRVEPVEAEIRARLAERERFFLDCWHSDEGQRRLKEAVEKF